VVDRARPPQSTGWSDREPQDQVDEPQQAADEITQSPTAYAGLPKRSVVPGVLLCRVEKGGGRVEEAWEVGEGRGRGEEH